ncbi:ABC transporter substrate binding protein [Methylobacterium sp. P31]
MPAIFPFVGDAGRGALIVYAADLGDLYRRCGGYVDKIIRGASPAGLPIEQPTKFLMIVNLRTADKIGIRLPDALIAMADQVID